MDVKKLKNSIEVLKENLDGALIASDIWPTGSGQSLVGYNSNAAATALFERVTENMNKTLKESAFPSLDQYYLLDLTNDSLIVVLLFEGYQWGMLVNKTKVQLGLLLNIAIPKARESFMEAAKV